MSLKRRLFASCHGYLDPCSSARSKSGEFRGERDGAQERAATETTSERR